MYRDARTHLNIIHYHLFCRNLKTEIVGEESIVGEENELSSKEDALSHDYPAKNKRTLVDGEPETGGDDVNGERGSPRLANGE